MKNPDKKSEDVKIFVAIVYAHCLDYNTFMTTTIVNFCVALPLIYKVVIESVRNKYDPYTKEPLYDDTEFIQSQFFLYILYFLVTTAHHYLVQRDLMIITIEKAMILRH